VKKLVETKERLETALLTPIVSDMGTVISSSALAENIETDK
jgi:hypothetical protein